MKTVFAALSAALLLAACQSSTPAAPDSNQPNLNQPNLNQPISRQIGSQCGRRMCTMQYEPVCATIQENGRTREQTFGNRCTVCGGGIVSVRQGACGSTSVR